MNYNEECSIEFVEKNSDDSITDNNNEFLFCFKKENNKDNNKNSNIFINTDNLNNNFNIDNTSTRFKSSITLNNIINNYTNNKYDTNDIDKERITFNPDINYSCNNFDDLKRKCTNQLYTRDNNISSSCINKQKEYELVKLIDITNKNELEVSIGCLNLLCLKAKDYNTNVITLIDLNTIILNNNNIDNNDNYNKDSNTDKSKEYLLKIVNYLMSENNKNNQLISNDNNLLYMNCLIDHKNKSIKGIILFNMCIDIMNLNKDITNKLFNIIAIFSKFVYLITDVINNINSNNNSYLSYIENIINSYNKTNILLSSIFNKIYNNNIFNHLNIINKDKCSIKRNCELETEDIQMFPVVSFIDYCDIDMLISNNNCKIFKVNINEMIEFISLEMNNNNNNKKSNYNNIKSFASSLNNEFLKHISIFNADTLNVVKENMFDNVNNNINNNLINNDSNKSNNILHIKFNNNNLNNDSYSNTYIDFLNIYSYKEALHINELTKSFTILYNYNITGHYLFGILQAITENYNYYNNIDYSIKDILNANNLIELKTISSNIITEYKDNLTKQLKLNSFENINICKYLNTALNTKTYFITKLINEFNFLYKNSINDNIFSNIMLFSEEISEEFKDNFISVINMLEYNLIELLINLNNEFLINYNLKKNNDKNENINSNNSIIKDIEHINVNYLQYFRNNVKSFYYKLSETLKITDTTISNTKRQIKYSNSIYNSIKDENKVWFTNIIKIIIKDILINAIDNFIISTISKLNDLINKIKANEDLFIQVNKSLDNTIIKLEESLRKEIELNLDMQYNNDKLIREIKSKEIEYEDNIKQYEKELKSCLFVIKEKENDLSNKNREIEDLKSELSKYTKDFDKYFKENNHIQSKLLLTNCDNTHYTNNLVLSDEFKMLESVVFEFKENLSIINNNKDNFIITDNSKFNKDIENNLNNYYDNLKELINEKLLNIENTLKEEINNKSNNFNSIINKQINDNLDLEANLKLLNIQKKSLCNEIDVLKKEIIDTRNQCEELFDTIKLQKNTIDKLNIDIKNKGVEFNKITDSLNNYKNKCIDYQNEIDNILVVFEALFVSFKFI